VDFAPVFLHSKRPRLDLSLSEMGSTDAVVLELEKLRKPQVQQHEEKLKEIDNLHEVTKAINTRADWLESDTPVCAECWTLWPCQTHRIIHHDCGDCDVHRV
jgi:hypothetical protein